MALGVGPSASSAAQMSVEASAWKNSSDTNLNCDTQTSISSHTSSIKYDFQVPMPRSRGKVVDGKFSLANSIHKCK